MKRYDTQGLGECPHCHSPNAYETLNCATCGARLPWANAVVSARKQPPPIPSPHGTSVAMAPVETVGCLPVLGAGILCLIGSLLVSFVVASVGIDPNIFMVAVVLLTAIWVGYDASQLGVRKGLIKGSFDNSVASWVIGCLLLWVFVFPAYLMARPIYQRYTDSPQFADAAPSTGERKVFNLVIAGIVGAFLILLLLLAIGSSGPRLRSGFTTQADDVGAIREQFRQSGESISTTT